MDNALASAAAVARTTERRSAVVSAIAFLLFFVIGGVTSLNDVLMPKLKDLFQLTYAQMTLVQFAYFTAYFLISIPAAYLVARVGYVRALVAGLVVVASGSLLFVPAAASAQFAAFLGALLVVAAGITVVQVTVNPFVSRIGRPETTAARLTFAHACNSIGTVVAPFLGAMIILGAASQIRSDTLTGLALVAHRAAEAAVIGRTYVVIAFLLAAIAVPLWWLRSAGPETGRTVARPLAAFDLLRRPRVACGVAAMFLYVGAEVTIGSLLVNYLGQASTLGLTHEAAGQHLAFYWGGLLVGRLFGIGLLRLVAPHRFLILCGLAAMVLVGASILTTGAVSGWTLIAVGLFNSVMFPLIFTLTSEGLGERAPEGSGLICVAIVGGAVVPVVTGHLADLTSLSVAMVVPALCYLGIVAFGWFARRDGAST